MAMILRSDKVATNPDIDWKYVTPFGPTHKEVAEYLAAITTDTFNPGEPVFAALDKFVTDLKAAGLWERVPEVMPFYGINYASICRKLKGEWGGLDMASVNGDQIGNYELVGGAYIGRKKIERVERNGPALNTGFTAAPMNLSWGFTALIDNDLSGDAVAATRSIMGARMQGESAVRQVEARVQYDTGFTTGRMSAANFGSVNLDDFRPLIAGLHRFSARKTDIASSSFMYTTPDGASYYTNGNYDEYPPRNSPIWLMALSPEPGGSSISPFNGRLRFAAFDDGTLSASEVVVLFDAINSLADAMGKAF